MREFFLSPRGVLCAYLLVINLAAFGTMGWDKWRAKIQGARRVPEKRLFLLAILGGALGATAGMFVFHHKTRHWYFRYGLPLILLAELLLPPAVRYWLSQ